MTRGVDWSEHLTHKRNSIARSRAREEASRARRQADKDKAARDKAKRDELLRTGLYGDPVPAPDPRERLRFRPIRWRSDRSWGAT